MLFIVRKKKRRTGAVESSFFVSAVRGQSLPVVERSCKATDKGWLRLLRRGGRNVVRCSAPGPPRAKAQKRVFRHPFPFCSRPEMRLRETYACCRGNRKSWQERRATRWGNYTLVSAGKAPGRVQGGSVCPEIATCLIRGNSLPGRVSEAARTRKRRQPHGRPCARSSP